MSITAMALDVGERRIGVAVANIEVGLSQPLLTLQNDINLFATINKLIRERQVAILVVGLPRNLSGDDTSQTQYTRDFIEKLKQHVDVPVYSIDEAGTSAKAKDELAQKGKDYVKSDIDALAATYILEDFLASEASTITKVKQTYADKKT